MHNIGALQAGGNAGIVEERAWRAENSVMVTRLQTALDTRCPARDDQGEPPDYHAERERDKEYSADQNADDEWDPHEEVLA